MGAEPMRFGLVDRPRCATMRARALAELGHDDISPDALVGSLSVAAQQLVEIARAIAVGCRVLVLDEPTSSLGRADVERLFALLAPPEGAGARDRLHLALHRGGEGGRRPLHRAARRPQCRRRRHGRTRRTTTSSSLMVGGRVGDLFPRSPRAPRRGHPGGRRRSSRDRRRSRCTAARSSASPGCLDPGGRACCARSSASSRCAADACASAMFSGRGHAAGALARRAWACSARTARTRGSRSDSTSPTT